MSSEIVKGPVFFLDAECIRPDENGEPKVVWRDSFQHADGTPGNVVVNEGAAMILNRIFGSSAVAQTIGAFINLHSATTASDQAWSNISASQVKSYGNSVPRATFTTGANIRSTSQSVTYGFTASTQTVSGAAIHFYTASTQSTNAATGDIIQYSVGQFGTARTVQNADTLNVTVTVSFATV
jgi:hypothetical protein